jgi:SWI/SNF-related matrix-associated actin-dependent regulator of chromatin subfamily A-like protein 1
MITVKPYQFQVKGFEFIRTLRWGMIADEMGLGKTLQALMLVDDVKLQTAIVAPASMVKTWELEAKKFIDWVGDSEVKLARDVKKGNYPTITIFSYSDYSNTKYEEFLEGCEVVIFDESHYIKNADTIRSKMAMKIATKFKPEYLLMLTGTPIPNGIVDIYHPLCILSNNPKGLADIRAGYASLELFGREFAYATLSYRPSRYGRSRVQMITYKGFRPERRKVLQGILRKFYIRRLAKNVLELPPLVIKDVYLGKEEIPEGLKAYEAFLENPDNKTPHIMRLKSQVAYHTADSTISYAKQLFSDLGGKAPLIIYTDHLTAIQKLHLELRKVGKVARIEGSTAVNNRQQIVDRFQSGDVDFLLCTIGAAAEGITLTYGSNIIFNDLPWTPKDYEQVIRRILRIGQNKHCNVHRILYAESSRKMAKMLDSKIADIKTAIGE